jgi:hypothetical protein
MEACGGATPDMRLHKTPVFDLLELIDGTIVLL